MIRLLFVVFVTVGAFAAAALWNARDRDALEQPQTVVSPDLNAMVEAEADRLGLAEATERLRAAANGESAGIPEAEALPVVSPPSAAEAEPPLLADGGAGGALEPEGEGGGDEAENSVGDEIVARPSEFARDLGAAVDLAEETTDHVLAAEGTTGVPDWRQDASPHDSDRSAQLIRRMLALYRSTGAPR